MTASVGLIALWTGEMATYTDQLRQMAIHQMTLKELEQFSTFAREVERRSAYIANYIEKALEE